MKRRKHFLEAIQRQLDRHSDKPRQRREPLDYPFGTIKIGTVAHLFIKQLEKVRAEMALVARA